MMTISKEQELKILGKIKALVESAGEDSYISMAFEGCLDDAENNINYDFGNSMKARYESAKEEADWLREQVKTLHDKLLEVEKEYTAAHAEALDDIDRKDAEIAALRMRIIDPVDLDDCIMVMKGKADEHRQEATGAASRIVELADKPESTAFTAAVRDHRNSERAVEYYEAIYERLRRISSDLAV